MSAGPWMLVVGPNGGPEVRKLGADPLRKYGPVYVSPAWLALLGPPPDDLDDRADDLAEQDAARREWALQRNLGPR